MRITHAMQLVEARDPKGRDIRTILRETYNAHGGVVPAAEALGVPTPTFSAWIRRLGGRIESEVVFPEPEREKVAA